MLRVIHKVENRTISASHKGFSVVSRVLRLVNKYKGARLIQNLKATIKVDGNLMGFYGALSYLMGMSNNSLTIWAKKGCSLTLDCQKDLFGYYGGWDAKFEEAFKSGATRLFAFNRHDYDGFNHYLLFHAFRKDWKNVIPYHYKLDVKAHLRQLFRNASEHSNVETPIFISSSYSDDTLRFTIVDCGEGFLKRVRVAEEKTASQSEAIFWALNGNSVKGSRVTSSLRSLGEYCVNNNGELFVVSGCASVLYNIDGFHQFGILPGPLRGSMICLSVGIKRMVFEESQAA